MNNQTLLPSNSPPLFAQCHCTSISGPIYPQILTSEGKLQNSVQLCHCSICRYSTGLLFTSYIPIAAPSDLALGKTTAYSTRPSDLPPASAFSCEYEGMQRNFCATCGCHVFRSRPREHGTENGERDWEVATGVLNNVAEYFPTFHQINVSDTKDGGLSIFLPEPNHQPPQVSPALKPEHSEAEPSNVLAGQASPALNSKDKDKDNKIDILPAHCACGTVTFHLTRPNAQSTLPHSPFPDLILPYHTHHPWISNPQDEKWWLRPLPTAPECLLGSRYLAGTCACRSCRLTSGFEVQTWAFVPRCNIFLSIPSIPIPGSAKLGAGSGEGQRGRDVMEERGEVPVLDFDALRVLQRGGRAVLKGYESSEGVVREFCPGCGATVFWHDKWRPDVVDVSVGLLGAEGARAEGWLEWWGRRVSFREDAEGRGGLVPALENGLRTRDV